MIRKFVFGVSAPLQRHGNCHTKARVVGVTRAWKNTRARRALVLLLLLLLLLLSLSLSLLFLWLLLLLIIVGAMPKHRVNMDWTLGLFFWTIFWIIFLDHFLDHLLFPFFGPFYLGHTISTQERVGYSLSVLREGWEPDCCYSGRGERRTISTQGTVGGGCICKCTDWWSFHWIIQIFGAVLRLTIFM